MNDLISRRALLEAMPKHDILLSFDVRKVIRDAPAVDAIPCWISVEEGPPKEWRAKDKDKTLINYLVFMPEYGVDVGNWIKDANMWVVLGLPAKVTHWMPLPKPPKEENAE